MYYKATQVLNYFINSPRSKYIRPFITGFMGSNWRNPMIKTKKPKHFYCYRTVSIVIVANKKTRSKNSSSFRFMEEIIVDIEKIIEPKKNRK